MTVMLLQRFSAPQSTFVTKNKTKYLHQCEYEEERGAKGSSSALELNEAPTAIDIYLTSSNNNNININNNYQTQEKIRNATNSCKSERASGRTANNNDGEAEDDELLARDKLGGRQETITSNVTTTTIGTTGSALSASQGRFCGQGVAMRYYRLWIYACNIVLLGSALGLAAAVSRTLVFSSDPRRHLVPGVPRALDPTAVYAYLALAIQLGLVQLLGCIAARRLSVKLLNAYWVLLLALLFGDAIIGVAWVFRFEKMRAELRPTLRLRLQLEYARDPRFSEHWDQLQHDFSCCGMTGPSDFDRGPLPVTCCPVDPGPSQDRSGNDTFGCRQPFADGCEETLMSWLRKTGDLLFVVGFCVMAFAKLCFLGILKYEIREMIQKIRLLRDPPPPATSHFIQSFCQPVATPLPTATTSTGGTTVATATTTIAGMDAAGVAACYGGPRRTTLPIVVSSSAVTNNLSFGNNVLVAPQLTQEYSTKHPLLYTTNLQQDTGADSDTNSHCALILEETSTPTSQRNCSAGREKSNGNNNYEMHEFNRRYLMSNGASPPGIKINVGQSKRT